MIYCIFLWDDEMLLTIIKMKKFNHKYWPRKLYFVIGILRARSKPKVKVLLTLGEGKNKNGNFDFLGGWGSQCYL